MNCSQHCALRLRCVEAAFWSPRTGLVYKYWPLLKLVAELDITNVYFLIHINRVRIPLAARDFSRILFGIFGDAATPVTPASTLRNRPEV